MFFRMLRLVWDFGLDIAAVRRMTDDEQDLEILCGDSSCGASNENKTGDLRFRTGRECRWSP
jgi:hypothetical protein